MTIEITQQELAFFDKVTNYAGSIWNKTAGVEGLSSDPRMFSSMLFKRLWSNHQGYIVLWKQKLHLEADIILRSGIEAAICLAACYHLKSDFVQLMRGDTIYTLKGQIKMWREDGAEGMVRDSEALLRRMQQGFPDHAKADRLRWDQLAEAGQASHLYGWHRMLSGVSSHVTGISVITGIEDVADPSLARSLGPHQRKLHLMMMANGTLTGARHQAAMFEDEQGCREALELLDELYDLSFDLPGVTDKRPVSMTAAAPVAASD